MSKIISQDTFDDAVRENIVEFAMGTDEAKEETIKQFQAQGCNLANIIKDLRINSETGKPVLNESLDDLKTHIGEKSTDKQKLLEYLTNIDVECRKSLAHQVLAGKLGAHDALITLLEQELSTVGDKGPDMEVLEQCLNAINSLSNKQPDFFDAEALSVVLRLLKRNEGNIVCLTLQWLQKACYMHEMNRQNIMNSTIMQQLKPLLTKEKPKEIREVLAVFRNLVLDDDIRVEISSAHEHARQIASQVIVQLTKLLGDFKDLNILSDLLLTIAALAVRQEFCTTIHEVGGLKKVFDIMNANADAIRLNREALKLLRALGGNDAVKVLIVEEGGAPIIKNLLDIHMANENLAAAALVCISTLTLRVKQNSAAFFDTGIAETIVEVLRLHPNSKIVQRNGAWAIRNMVSRSREQCETWLSFGVEELLNLALKEHVAVKQDIKAALRDLGCEVELKEEWTGTAEKKIVNESTVNIVNSDGPN